MRCLFVALFAVSVSACTAHLPGIKGTISDSAQAADYPSLSPLPDLIARSQAGTTVVVETKALEGRVARLKTRAAALKGRSTIDGATRLKLLEATRGRPL